MKKKIITLFNILIVVAFTLSFSVSALTVDSDLVKQVQEALNSKGYDAGTADGIIGPRTNTAIEKYKKDNNLSADSEINEELLESMELITPSSNSKELNAAEETECETENETEIDPLSFEPIGAPNRPFTFYDFRETNFSVTIPKNEEGPFYSTVNTSYVSFSDHDKEIPSCEAKIYTDKKTGLITSITVYSPDEATLKADKFKELFRTIIIKLGITDSEETAQEMVDAAYEAEEPIVLNNTFLHLNTIGNGFMIQY